MTHSERVQTEDGPQDGSPMRVDWVIRVIRADQGEQYGNDSERLMMS